MKSDAGKRFLIVKTSSLGDIIQAFSVLNYLKDRYPKVSIDWVVENRFASIVLAHPLIERTISFEIKNFKNCWYRCFFWKNLIHSFILLRRYRYDTVIDLQGNCKSGTITFLSRGRDKVGFGRKTVREWPNILATSIRFDVPFSINIRLQYVTLVQQYFHDASPVNLGGVRFKLTSVEQNQLQMLLSLPALRDKAKIMVCPGSKWINKQLPTQTLSLFLEKIEKTLKCSFILVWGDEEEKKICQAIQKGISHCSVVIDRLELPLWQNLMNEVDLVIAVDSSALHLCGTTSTPSFSVFGPTQPNIFKPVGQSHFAYQGTCPYNRVFEKQCSLLRSCPTGACIRNISSDELFLQFQLFWQSLTPALTVGHGSRNY